VYADANEDVLRPRLRVFDEHVEVAVVRKDPGVEELVLGVESTASLVGFHQITVRVRTLRILVQILHVRVRGRAVEVEVVLLDVLSVISLAVGQAEQPFLDDGVVAIPKRKREPCPTVFRSDTVPIFSRGFLPRAHRSSASVRRHSQLQGPRSTSRIQAQVAASRRRAPSIVVTIHALPRPDHAGLMWRIGAPRRSETRCRPRRSHAIPRAHSADANPA
jgi:hypothetical protein